MKGVSSGVLRVSNLVSLAASLGNAKAIEVLTPITVTPIAGADEVGVHVDLLFERRDGSLFVLEVTRGNDGRPIWTDS